MVFHYTDDTVHVSNSNIKRVENNKDGIIIKNEIIMLKSS
jgi:hypothetical protein